MDWSKFIEETKPLFTRIALSYTKSIEDAEDIVQETYTDIFIKEYFDNPTGVGVVMVKNKSINLYRKKGKKKIYDINFRELTSSCNELDRFIAIDQIARIEEILEPLRFELLQLYASGYQYKELVDLMQIKLGTIKSRIHLSRKVLIQAEENNQL